VTFGEQGTIEEQRLSEMLHRLTPEPPRGVTVEDIAIRLANQNAPARGAGKGAAKMSGRGGYADGGRPRRGRLSPLLAAAAVVVIAGASAGIAVALSSNTSKAPQASTGGATSAATSQAPTASASPATVTSSAPPSSAPAYTGPWAFSTLATVTLNSATLTAGPDGLYAFTADNLVEIDPSTGRTTHEAPANGFPGQAPVIAGNKVWQVTNYGGGSISLSGYNPQTLAADGTITAPVTGGVAGNPQSILTAGPGGDLYLAAGGAIDDLNPASDSVIRQVTVPGGGANSVAVSPDGNLIYAGVAGSSYRIVEINASTGAVVASASVGANQDGGALVATSGGVWFSNNNGQAWFAPAGDLSAARQVAESSAGGVEATPTYTDGAVWTGGSSKLECLDPATGRLRASSPVPTSQQVPEGIGDIVSAGGHVYALYVDNRTAMTGQVTGVLTLNPPAACTTGSSAGSSGGSGS
jgi:hypothetical protein